MKRIGICLALLSFIVSNAYAVSFFGSDSIIVCGQPFDQTAPQMVSDGLGGTIVVWEDRRGSDGAFYDVYAQRIDANGSLLWTVGGDSISTADDDQNAPQIVADGSHGAIIVWQDYRNFEYDIYAQRINASGTSLWTQNGIPVCNFSGQQTFPKIVSDGAGGAIIGWRDLRNDTDYNIYAQRIDSNGALKWNPDGVQICNASHDQTLLQMMQNGVGGAILVWEDYRNLDITSDIYAQAVSSTSGIQWTPNGVKICGASNYQVNPQVASDGAGGAFIVWQDFRSGTNYDVYARRVNSSGVPQGSDSGIVISSALNDQTDPKIVSDGLGGAAIIWNDYRSGNGDMYGQHLSSSGIPTRTVDGVPISTASGDQLSPQMIYAGIGKQVIAWDDFRNGNSDIYVKYADSTGTMLHLSTEGEVTSAPLAQEFPQMVPDTLGTWVVWQDYRSGSNYDIYARFSKLNTTQVRNGWNIVSLPLNVSDPSKASLFGAAISNAYAYVFTNPGYGYRRRDTLLNGPGYWLKFNGTQSVPIPGIPINQDTIAIHIGWNLIGSIATTISTASVVQVPPNIVTSSYYAYNGSYVPTSTIEPYKGYWVKAKQIGQLVLSHASSEIFFKTEPISTTFLPHQLNTITLRDSLGNSQTLYFASCSSNEIAELRQEVSSVIQSELPPIPPVGSFDARFGSQDAVTFFVLDTAKTISIPIHLQLSSYPLVITTAINDHVGYKLTDNRSLDYTLSGNDSIVIRGPEIEGLYLSAGMTMGSDIPKEFALYQNFPNPFNPTTNFRFSLPVDQLVTLAVFDVLGQRVTTLVNQELKAGSYAISWNASNFSSGVYYYRIQTPTFTQTKRLVLLK